MPHRAASPSCMPARRGRVSAQTQRRGWCALRVISVNSRALRAAGPAILVVAALAVMVWALAYGGGAAPLAIGDPGPFVRWGLPTATLFVNLVGRGHGRGARHGAVHAESGRARVRLALDAASISAAVFTVSAAATGFLTFVDAFNPASTPDPSSARSSAGSSSRPRSAARGSSRRSRVPRSRCWPSRCGRGRPTLFVAILAIAALVPMGTQGHSGEEANHDEAMMALILHIIAAAVWLGGLLLMVLVRPVARPRPHGHGADALLEHRARRVRRRRDLGHRARRDRAAARGRRSLSPYGAILLVKVVALIALGVLGAWYRRRLIGRLRRGCGIPPLLDARRARARAHGRGRAAPPRRSPARLRRRRRRLPAMPHARGAPHRRAAAPELTPIDWLTAWNLDLLWALAAGFGIFLYLAGVLAAAPARRRVAALPHRPVGRGSGPAGLGDRRRRERLPGLPVQHAHGRAHAAHDGDPDAARRRRTGHARRPGDPQARRRHARRARVDPLGGAVAGRRRADEPVRRGRAVHRLALGLLLHRPVPLVAVRPPRARVDGRALPHHRLPVRADADRHRSDPVPPALRRAGSSSSSASWRCTRSSASRS